MKKYIIRFAILFYSKKTLAGSIVYMAPDKENAQDNAFEQLYQFMKEKAINKGDHELDLFSGTKKITLTVE